MLMHNIIYFKNRTIDFNKTVKIYRNLHKKGKVYSIVQNKLVCGYTDNITLTFCNFKINQSGKNRAIQSGIRNVHAYIEGFISDVSNSELTDLYQCEVKYNPFQSEGFITEDKNIIFQFNWSEVMKIINGIPYAFLKKRKLAKLKENL